MLMVVSKPVSFCSWLLFEGPSAGDVGAAAAATPMGQGLSCHEPKAITALTSDSFLSLTEAPRTLSAQLWQGIRRPLALEWAQAMGLLKLFPAVFHWYLMQAHDAQVMSNVFPFAPSKLHAITIVKPCPPGPATLFQNPVRTTLETATPASRTQHHRDSAGYVGISSWDHVRS